MRSFLDRVDMDRVVKATKAVLDMDPDELAAELKANEEAGQERYDTWLKTWLAQYDSNGELIPGIYGTEKYVRNMDLGYLALDYEARKQYIISEKKRLSVL